MDEEGIQALLLYALDTGRLANAKDDYDNPMIADAGTTIFNLNAGGEEKVVTVYALFEMPDRTCPTRSIEPASPSSRNCSSTSSRQVEDGVVTDVASCTSPSSTGWCMIEGMGEPDRRADRLAVG